MRPLSKNSIVMAVKDQVSSNVRDEAVVLHLKRGVYYGLNSSGALVWNNIQTPRRVEELCRLLLENYDADAVQCERDLLSLIGNMADQGLVEVTDAASS